MGKLFDIFLEKCGGERIISRGEGDDDADIEADFAAWSEKLVEILTKTLGPEEADISSSYDEESGLVVVEHDPKFKVGGDSCVYLDLVPEGQKVGWKARREGGRERHKYFDYYALL